MTESPDDDIFFAPFARNFVSFAVNCFLFSILIFHSDYIFSQDNKLSEVILSIAEELAADESDPEAIAIYINKLNDLAENPININSADEEELSALFFLTEFQVKALADYSHSTGKIYSVYEIANIPGFDRQVTEMLIPFIEIETLTEQSKPPSRLRNSFLTNVSFKPGSTDTTSIGSDVKLLSKYRFFSGGFAGGFTVEKDPGEKFFPEGKPLPDFASAYLSYKGRGFVRKIVIGDFSVRSGLGTNVNTGMRTSLSLTSTGYSSPANEVKEYTSADENNFFRGVAAEFSVNKFSFSGYFSSNNIDASPASFSGSAIDHVENLYSAGLHNTPSLLLKKDVLTNTSAGINIAGNFSKTRFGVIASYDRLSLPVINESSDPVDLHDFRGNRGGSYSAYYNIMLKKLLLFGEVSVNEPLKYAVIQGLTAKVSDRLTINTIYRNYEPGYFSLHGRGPGSSSSGWNETSAMGNFTFEAAKHLFISGGAELRQYPWLRYRNSAPSRSVRQEVRVKFLPSENLTAEMLYNYRLTMADSAESSGIPGQKETITRYLKGSVKYSPSKNFTLAVRADYKVVNTPGGRGMLVLQDVSYKFRNLPVTIWLRYCIFNTGNWDSRIYTYENDLLYSFSVPALSGEGSKSYIMVKYDLGERVDLRVKYGVTSIREGKDVLDKQECKLQVRVLF
jgi:hypothetical protein